MSRSYRKPKVGICTGSNTEYYRERNRNTRMKNKRELRKLSKYRKLEDFDEESEYLNFIKNNRNKNYNTWCEPTDGSYMLRESNFNEDNKKYYERAKRK